LLTILVADCQPVMLYDPVRAVVANIHSGWRGSIADIIGRTVAVMKERFACRPAEIIAGIGPSLGPCCAEFVNYRQEIPEALWSYQVSDNHFDFWALSRDQLVWAGLLPEHIETGGICTRCHSDLFFSYRAAQQTGRMAAVIGLPSTRAEGRRS
jgi:YfiH family protein